MTPPYRPVHASCTHTSKAADGGARTESQPFERPATGKIAVEVINDYGDEVVKVFEV